MFLKQGSLNPLIHILILAAISLPYFINLDKSSIWDANEAFYAETPREMLVSGDYLAPTFNFEPRVQKPPLTYWVVLISYKIFGVGEFAVRLPSALAALGTLLFSYGLGMLLFSRRAALLSAIITATTARIFILARRLPIDILLLFFLTGTLFFVVRALQKRDRFNWAMAYVFAAFGFLTKGPVAAAIPAGAYLLWQIWQRRLNIRQTHPVMGILIFICIALPWYVYIYAAHGWTYIAPFFLRDNFGRFAAESLGPSRSFFYYLSVYATDFFPWSFPVLFILALLWIGRKEEEPLKSLSFGLPLFWCALVFLFFSLSKNKQEYYIAPIYPVAAVILAGFLDKTITRVERSKRELQASPHRTRLSTAWHWVYGSLAALILLFALIIPHVLSSFIPNISLVLHYGPSMVFIIGFVLLAWSMYRGEHIRCFSAIAVPLWTTYLMCALMYLPAIEAFRPVKEFCRIIDFRSGQNDEAGFYGTALPSMVYYLRRPIFQESNPETMLSRFRSEKRVFCILGRKDYAVFSEQKNLTLHILQRHSRFAVRLGTVMNAGYLPGEELLLVSNRP